MARAKEGDRPVLIPHVDDLGVSHGANQAFVELAGLGFVTCGSVMPPCGWFTEMVEMAKAQPALDVGVHLTLTSESRACRWRPISTASRASGLLDGDGYMWPDVPSVRRHADPGAVETELRAQIEAALAAGLDVTHLDTHMGAAAAPEFAAIYAALGREYRLPVLLTRESASYDSVLAMGPVERNFYERLIAELGEGVPLIDRFAMGLAMTHLSCEEAYREIVARGRHPASPSSRCTAIRRATSRRCTRMTPPGESPSTSCSRTRIFWPGLPRRTFELGGFRAIRDRYREDLAKR